MGNPKHALRNTQCLTRLPATMAGFACLCLLTLHLFPRLTYAQELDYTLGSWKRLTPMPGGKFIHRSLVVNGYLYAIGGAYPPTFYARIRDDGSLEGWKTTAPLAVNYPAAAVKGNRIYVIAGDRQGETLHNFVLYGDVQADGSIPEWKQGRSLPEEARAGGEAVVCRDYLFYIGGWHWRKVYRSLILPTNGDLGEWREMQHLLSPRFAMGAAVMGDVLYVYGGSKTHLNPTDSAYRALVLPDGNIQSWKRTTSLPKEISSFAKAQYEDHVYILGGGDFTNSAYAARILSTGDFSEWQVVTPVPCRVTLAAAVACRGWLYLTGGWCRKDDGTHYVSNEVYAAQLISPHRFPLRFRPHPNVVKSLGWIQLKKVYRQRGNQPVVIEAEESTSVELASSDMTPVADPEASAGLCLQHVSSLCNQIIIEQAGEYQAWYRAYFPFKGSWIHYEQMDEGEKQIVQDSVFGEDKKWLWVKGPSYALAKGVHTYLWPSPTAWRGGARLDKIVLAPQGASEPTGIGPAASPSECATAAELVSNRFRLDDFSAWRLACEKEEGGGRIALEYSSDRGKSWQPLRGDKPRTITKGIKRMTFRVRLTRGASGTSPRIRRLWLLAFPHPAAGKE